jgi:hypothetical protein
MALRVCRLALKQLGSLSLEELHGQILLLIGVGIVSDWH